MKIQLSSMDECKNPNMVLHEWYAIRVHTKTIPIKFNKNFEIWQTEFPLKIQLGATLSNIHIKIYITKYQTISFTQNLIYYTLILKLGFQPSTLPLRTRFMFHLLSLYLSFSSCHNIISLHLIISYHILAFHIIHNIKAS